MPELTDRQKKQIEELQKISSPVPVAQPSDEKDYGVIPAHTASKSPANTVEVDTF